MCVFHVGFKVTALGMNFAVVVDNYAEADLVNTLKEPLRELMSMPNYYRVYGRAVLPYYEHPERQGSAQLPSWRSCDGHHLFVIGTFSAHNHTGELPPGYDSMFFWNSPDMEWLEEYYSSTSFKLKVGPVYRGWREAYRNMKQSPPYLGYLGHTLKLVRRHRPHFAQLVTWNDYGEGTMLEPSYLRNLEESGCGDPRDTEWYSETRTARRGTLQGCAA